jgi:hypothetical protein
VAGPLENFSHQLLAGTRNGSAKWERTQSQDTYRIHGDSGIVEIKRVSAEPLTIRLTIADADGNSVGSIETEPYRPGAWYAWEKALMSLFSEVELQASGTADVLKGLKNELGLPDAPLVDDDLSP